MGLFDKIRNEFIDIIEWVDDSSDTIVWKFPRYQNEIKMNAQLTVREGQVAVFMNEGVIADVFSAGRHVLTTQNMPIMTTLQGWKYGFNSPFKADVFFVSLRQFTNQKWGTKNPIMLRDVEFGPVRLRAFGSYAFQVKDAAVFLKQIAATNPTFTIEDINEQLRNIAVTRGMDAIAESKIAVLDLASNYDEVSVFVQQKISPEFEEIGLSLTKFLVENISLPEEVEKVLDKRSSMGIVGNLGAYAQFQAANAMEKAAENPSGGGIMGAGLGVGLGAGMAGQMGGVFQQNKFDGNNPSGTSAAVVPPAIPTAVHYFLAINGVQAGPFTIEQLKEEVQKGTLLSSTLAWKAGLENWKEANQIEELKNLFHTVPPPLPGV
ncbi:SPFH domain-containing protein [Sphingobacterium sp. SRCM116780]|uniref:SPFH domain-containing protein n=1 Tax=Sphingobacterium sp. SRCM116780 TaxID=2907623 RepID=UPI001F362EC6|nr:SPFH domain-containing protein [Sphingobacterium sp. SRCM116780]UIR55077.1 SPFH domain-containing protein [Sphingobacterium sp. SRCM116780]